MRPPPTGDAGAWAEANRILPEGSPEPGPYRTARVPYLREVFAAYADDDVREVDVLTGSQMGKTDGILNILGHRMDWGPRVPALYVAPTQDLAKSVSEERARSMIQECESLNALHEKGRRDRVAEKYFAGLRLGFAWAGSKAQLASRPAGLAIIDELDRCELDVEGEGSPVVLVSARGKNYAGFTIGTWTTPTIEDVSAGQARFDLGTRQVWSWSCPACSESFAPWSAFLRWDKSETKDPAAIAMLAEATARLVCPACGEEYRDDRKAELEQTGHYVRHLRERSGDYVPDPDPPPPGSRRSYWIPGLASPWVTFSQLAGRLAAAYATHDQAVIQATINTECGELYRTRGSAPASEEVQSLRVELKAGEVPEWVQAITAGVDVQKDRLFYAVRGWGPGLSSHLIEHGEIIGETEYDSVWIVASRLLERRWRGLPIVHLGVDAGYRPGELFKRPEHMVYEWARRHPGRVYPCRGQDVMQKPWTVTQLQKRGMPLVNVNTDHAKTWVHGRISWPPDAELGRWTLNADTSDDYCEQIVSEHVVTTAAGKRRWIAPRRAANHYLDCEALAYTMASVAHLELLTPPQTAPQAGARAIPTPQGRRAPEFDRRPLS